MPVETQGANEERKYRMDMRSTTAVVPLRSAGRAAPGTDFTMASFGRASFGQASFTLHFTGYLYAVGLRDAFADLMFRHEQLRTVYPMPGSSAAPRVLSATDEIVPCLVPAPVAAAGLADAVAAFMDEETIAPLAKPMRARVFRPLGDPEEIPRHLLVVILQRAAADRVSSARIARDLMTAYAARRRSLVPSWDVVRPSHRLPVHELQHVQLTDIPPGWRAEACG